MRTDDLGRRVASTSLWTAADYGTAFVAGFILAAIFVRTLGPTAYGVYLLVLLVSAPGLLSLVDLGMGGVVVSFTARYRAEGSDLLPRLWSFATAYYVLLATLVPTVTAVIIAVFRDRIEAALASVGVAPEILLLIVALQAFSILTLMFEYLLSGMFDYRPIQLSSIVMQLVRLGGSALLLARASDVVTLVGWIALCSAGRAMFLGGWTTSRYRPLMGRVHVAWVDARTWLAYSTSLLARNVAGLVFNFSDRLLISVALPVARLAQYDIAAKPANMIRALLSISTSAVVTASATAAGLDRRDHLQQLYLRGGRVATVIFVPALIFLLVEMRAFVELWVGPAYLNVVPIGQLFLASFALAMVPAIGDAMILGIGEAQKTLKVTWIAAAINLAVSVALVAPLGILGVVLGTVAGAIVSDVWLSRIHLRLLGVSARQLAREVVVPVAIATAATLVTVALLNAVLDVTSWSSFLAAGGATAVISYAIALRLSLTHEDRALIGNFINWTASRSPRAPVGDEAPLRSGSVAGQDQGA